MQADDFVYVEVTSVKALWQWLNSHHATSSTVWLVTWKALHREKYVSRDQVLDALLSYGWIDGRRMKLDHDRTMQLISPRKTHTWTKTYRERANRLIDEGHMQTAGMAVIKKAKSSGLYFAGQNIDDLNEPNDLIKALSEAGAKTWWDGSAKSYRRNVLRWLSLAKRDATRVSRMERIVSFAAEGKKVPHY